MKMYVMRTCLFFFSFFFHPNCRYGDFIVSWTRSFDHCIKWGRWAVRQIIYTYSRELHKSNIVNNGSIKFHLNCWLNVQRFLHFTSYKTDGNCIANNKETIYCSILKWKIKYSARFDAWSAYCTSRAFHWMVVPFTAIKYNLRIVEFAIATPCSILNGLGLTCTTDTLFFFAVSRSSTCVC